MDVGKRAWNTWHLAVCPMLLPLRSKLATLTGEPRFRTNNLTFLIGDSEIGVMERGTANLWFCMWYALTLAMIDCTEDGTAVSVDRVWKRSLQLFAEASLSTSHEARQRIVRALARQLEPPEDFPALSARLSPLGHVRSDGAIEWAPHVRAELVELGLVGYVNHVA